MPSRESVSAATEAGETEAGEEVVATVLAAKMDMMISQDFIVLYNFSTDRHSRSRIPGNHQYVQARSKESINPIPSLMK